MSFLPYFVCFMYFKDLCLQLFFGEGVREQYPPNEEDTVSCIIVFRMSHARSL